MAQFGAAISFCAAPFTSGAGARRNFQRRRQKHLLRLRAGLVLFGDFFISTATTDDSNEDAGTNVATDSGFLLLPTYTPSVSSARRCAATTVAASREPDSNAAVYYNGDDFFCQQVLWIL